MIKFSSKYHIKLVIDSWRQTTTTSEGNKSQDITQYKNSITDILRQVTFFDNSSTSIKKFEKNFTAIFGIHFFILKNALCKILVAIFRAVGLGISSFKKQFAPSKRIASMK